MRAKNKDMRFIERKKKTNFEYECEDVFGKVSIVSPVKLTGEILDEIIVILLRQNLSAETVKGSVKLENDQGVVEYIFEKAKLWEEEDEEESCNDTHTSTNEQAKGSIHRSLLNLWGMPKNIMSSCKRFAVAFREAWKNAKSK